MSGENPYTRNFSHSTSLESNDPPKRIVNAPTLYCIFALGVILVAVGTFITAHCYVGVPVEEQQSPIEKALQFIGPILLGCGGLSLIGISILCIVVCKTNKRRSSLISEPIFNVGPSTFYSPRLSKNEHFFEDDLGIENMSGPQEDDDPMKFLAKTVVAERRRKLSRKISPLIESNINTFNASNEQEAGRHNAMARQISRNESGTLQSGNYHTGGNSMFENVNSISEAEQKLKRTQGFEALLQDSGLYQTAESTNPGTVTRSRSHSMAGPKPKVFISRNEPLRRTATVTTENGKLHRNDLRNKELHRQLVEKQMHQTLKKNKKISGQSEHPQVHNLSSYSPEVIDSLIGMADNLSFERSSSYHAGEVMLNPAPLFNSSSRLDQLSMMKDGYSYSTTLSPTSFENDLKYPAVVKDSVRLGSQNENYLHGSLDTKTRKQKASEADYFPRDLPSLDKLPRKMNMGVSSLGRSQEGMPQEPENINRPSWESSDSSSSAQLKLSPDSLKKSSRVSRIKKKRSRKSLRGDSISKNSTAKLKHISEPNKENKIQKHQERSNSSDSEENNVSNCSCSSCANCDENPPSPAKAMTNASEIIEDLQENSDSGVVTTLRKNNVIHLQRNKALSIIRSSGHGSVLSSSGSENDLDNVVNV